MKIMALDYATKQCGVALLDGDKLINKRYTTAYRKHAEILAPIAKEVLEEERWKHDEIDSIAVTIGPGSFTGLRIGLSFAKGLAFPRNIPIIPINTLEVIARANGGHGVAMLHSHKDIVYYQSFWGNQPLSIIRYSRIESFVFSEKPNCFLGEAAKYFSPQIAKYFPDSDIIFNANNVSKGAELTGVIAREQFEKLVVREPATLVPNYISEFSIRR